MKVASCPLPAQESEFRNGPEFLAEHLGSQRVWVVYPWLRCPQGLWRSRCAKDSGLKLWKSRPAVRALGRIAEQLLLSASALPSFRPERARRQPRGAQNHPRHAGVALPAVGDASTVLTARNRANLGRDQ